MGTTLDGLSYWQAESEGIDLLESTIGDLLDRRAEELPAQEAVVYSCYPEFGAALSLRWTYQEYCDRANAVAKGLLALGLKKGEHIAIWAANIPEWLLIQMAAAKAGLVLVTINPLLQAAEVEYILKQGDVQALFYMAKVRTYDHLATIAALTTVLATSQIQPPTSRFTTISEGVEDGSLCLIDTAEPDYLIRYHFIPL